VKRLLLLRLQTDLIFSVSYNVAVYCASGTLIKSAWSEEDVASLCTPGCSSSLTNWLAKIDGACTSGQSAANNGFVEKARHVALDYIHGRDLVCLQDRYLCGPHFPETETDEHDSEQKSCFYESQSWQGSNYIRWDEYACEHEDPADNPLECEEPNFSTAQISGDMMAITNLYSKDLVRILALHIARQL
jgi:hypothetical protein